ncbi:MAG TPA: 2-amino-4-hydroxy-6-hydroxymethyldihydropteridine diphosphokinase [Oceanospirillales bacterium]|nr:2-amino-4-hydroxy-6-hydroxymethyldihydropteridine diphosphokinase [Oceanospirillales bacterium]
MGNSSQNLKQAIELIAEINAVEIVKKASLYVSAAWGKTDQADFVNSAICIKTTLSPQHLLDSLQNIEQQMGRVKAEKWGPRIIDIDILVFADFVVNQPQLSIPHPYICDRSFVLAPLLELNPQIFIPKLGKLSELVNKKKLNEGIKQVVSW